MTSSKLRLAVLVVLTVLVAAPVLAAGPISTEIALESSFLETSQNVYVNVTMTNDSGRAVRVLSWATPFNGIEDNLFEVAHNGNRVPYEGRVYKRGTPSAADFIVFAPGESLSAKVELSAYYDMSYGGEYVVRFRQASFDHAPQKLRGGQLLDLSSSEAVLWMEGEERPQFFGWEKAPGGNGGGGKPNRGACDNTQTATLANALAAAQVIAADAVSYLNGSSGPRYEEWFGTYTSSRWNTVGSHFDAISNALDNAPVEFDCSCKQSYYAYVYPNQPYKIYLCKAFWAAPMTGTDSKAGTLVHEISHFDVVAGTDDVTYGQSSCRALADSNPNDAIRNADSHEYFAENTPHLN